MQQPTSGSSFKFPVKKFLPQACLAWLAGQLKPEHQEMNKVGSFALFKACCCCSKNENLWKVQIN